MIPSAFPFLVRNMAMGGAGGRSQMQPFISGAGKVLDDYLPFTANPHSPTSREFYAFYVVKVQKIFQHYYGWYKLRRVDPEFSPNRVAKEVGPQLYEDMMKHIAAGKTKNLRDVVSENVYSNLKKSIKSREKGERHVWGLESLKSPNALHMILAAVDAEDRYIAQLSVEFKSNRHTQDTTEKEN